MQCPDKRIYKVSTAVLGRSSRFIYYVSPTVFHGPLQAQGKEWGNGNQEYRRLRAPRCSIQVKDIQLLFSSQKIPWCGLSHLNSKQRTSMLVCFPDHNLCRSIMMYMLSCSNMRRLKPLSNVYYSQCWRQTVGYT